jgi:hypothetical protein
MELFQNVIKKKGGREGLPLKFYFPRFPMKYPATSTTTATTAIAAIANIGSMPGTTAAAPRVGGRR